MDYLYFTLINLLCDVPIFTQMVIRGSRISIHQIQNNYVISTSKPIIQGFFVGRLKDMERCNYDLKPKPATSLPFYGRDVRNLQYNQLLDTQKIFIPSEVHK